MAKRAPPSVEPFAGLSPAELLEVFSDQLASSRVSSAVDAAQEIMFDAWECTDRRKRIAMARKALKVCGDCADAYVLLAEETAVTPQEALELYRQAVAAGERALGPAAFEEDVGMFWGLIETRPYMRARFGLALRLWEAGRGDEAVSHGEAMLRLNPGDNQGVRYVVLNWLQLLARDAEADALLRRFKEDGGTEWAWSGALAAFRRVGDRPASRKALMRAVEANGHVPAFLVGRKRIPRRIPEYVEFGGPDEAANYVETATPAWVMTPGALPWVGLALAEASLARAVAARRKRP